MENAVKLKWALKLTIHEECKVNGIFLIQHLFKVNRRAGWPKTAHLETESNTIEYAVIFIQWKHRKPLLIQLSFNWNVAIFTSLPHRHIGKTFLDQESILQTIRNCVFNQCFYQLNLQLQK